MVHNGTLYLYVGHDEYYEGQVAFTDLRGTPLITDDMTPNGPRACFANEA
jgi:hypothetical protein